MLADMAMLHRKRRRGMTRVKRTGTRILRAAGKIRRWMRRKRRRVGKRIGAKVMAVAYCKTWLWQMLIKLFFRYTHPQ